MTRWLGPVALSLVACVGGAPPPPRYLQPVFPAREAAPDPLPPLTGGRLPVRPEQPIALRLEHPTASAHLLEQRIVFRTSAAEVAYREQELWTDPPAQLLEQALASELFLARGLRRSGPGAATFALETRLVRFEEEVAPEHQVRVEVVARLVTADGETALERRFEARQPIPAETVEAMAAAMGTALDALSRQIADALLERLRTS